MVSWLETLIENRLADPFRHAERHLLAFLRLIPIFWGGKLVHRSNRLSRAGFYGHSYAKLLLYRVPDYINWSSHFSIRRYLIVYEMAVVGHRSIHVKV